MRPSLRDLDGRRFDVAVIGAGINGASAAQHLAAAGYETLLVERGDYCSGSSSRSTRLLHCGLRYLAPGQSMWEFLWHPSRLATALRMAKMAMEARRQFVQTAPERTRQLRFHFPIWEGGRYAAWQVNLALKVLASLAPKDVPLDNRVLSPSEAKAVPLVRELRDWDRLRAIPVFREYQFEWPERIAMDAVLDAERLGAVTRNYTEARQLRRDGEGWALTLADARDRGDTATVHARRVFNMAGIWIDRVNDAAGAHDSRKILGTKGVHIMVQLPPGAEEVGIATLNRLDEGFYCVPWRGMHYFGPTETVYEGNIDEIRPEEDEIEFLIGEANHLLPSLNLKRQDVLFAWAGVRPLTWDPALPKGKRSREMHDMEGAGLPGIFALTAGPVMTHRSAGSEAVATLGRSLPPSRPAAAVDYRAHLYPENTNAPPLLADYTAIKLSDLHVAAEQEHVVTLTDLMFRRVGAGWTRGMGAAEAETAARAVAPLLGWDEARIIAEVAAYRAYLKDQHRCRAVA